MGSRCKAYGGLSIKGAARSECKQCPLHADHITGSWCSMKRNPKPFIPNRQRPVMYTDWRALYHSECKALGFSLTFTRTPNRVHRFTRYQWERIRRLERIKKRLEVESEVMDKTYVKSLLNFVFSKQ